MANTQAAHHWRHHDDTPHKSQRVLGLMLDRYVSSEWQWSGPYLYVFDGKEFQGGDGTHRYREPDMWCEVPAFPPVPDTTEARRAKQIGRRSKELSGQIDDLERRRDRLCKGW